MKIVCIFSIIRTKLHSSLQASEQIAVKLFVNTDMKWNITLKTTAEENNKLI